ncbi:trypsin-like peptidase domain-containing protein [Gordonia jinhuaensis]|uniref:Serine protease PepD n=1 Tax=Gordonia jinhuaensis TaxID=1517702 RepID=A0A916WQF2_9ACTN|nr:trypsin-like peptidase domain-containing protein [Gordonia jinhuaensis]GGB24760.1 serine protease PepD [Gordonia jinhuaensis]
MHEHQSDGWPHAGDTTAPLPFQQDSPGRHPDSQGRQQDSQDQATVAQGVTRPDPAAQPREYRGDEFSPVGPYAWAAQPTQPFAHPGPGQSGYGPDHAYGAQPLGGTGEFSGPHPDRPTTPAPSRRIVAMPIVVTAVLAGLIGGGVGIGGAALLHQDSSSRPPALVSAPANTATNAADLKPGSITYAAQVASKSTVDIKVTGSSGTAVGSGIVLSPDGYVLTNNHVVSGADGGKITVTTTDGKSYSGSVKGTSPSYDLAVVKLAGASGLTPATLGQSSDLQVGQQVVAVGSPENLSNTVTSGIISALSRTVTAGGDSGESVAVYNGLQTDTPINPGNSGGPLVNLAGQVVGVNSAVDTGQSSQGGVQAFGLGFAIPVDTAKRVANQLLADGQATKPVLGVAGSLNDTSGSTGATVTSVTSGGPAAKAGIKAGEVITKIGDAPVSDYADLMAQVLTHLPGDTVPVTVSDGGSTHTVEVTLGSTVDKQQTTVAGDAQSDPFGSGSSGGGGYGNGGSSDGGSESGGGIFGQDPFGLGGN